MAAEAQGRAPDSGEGRPLRWRRRRSLGLTLLALGLMLLAGWGAFTRSEEHTSELQSH